VWQRWVFSDDVVLANLVRRVKLSRLCRVEWSQMQHSKLGSRYMAQFGLVVNSRHVHKYCVNEE
jgi:hypothetical protein